MLISKKNRIEIYKFLFREGVLYAEKDFNLPKHPMIDVTKEQRDSYIAEHDLPFHPLVAEGYNSIGCSHCTFKGEGREGRWKGQQKTECGLHL